MAIKTISFDNVLIALLALPLLLGGFVGVYALWKSVTADNHIVGCYLERDSLDYHQTRLRGRVEWDFDIVIGTFTDYEKAEAAMARYAACSKH